jgi:uroporphyrinogen-III synthase
MSRALVTRPAADAAPLAAALRARGIEPVIAPLLTITPRPEALPRLDDVRALLFTSANGVRVFAAASARRDLPVFAVGSATAAAARTAGFAAVESADGDVEALATLVAARRQPSDGKLMHVAGTTLAGDLAGRLGALGFEVATAALYDAQPAERLEPAVADDLAAGRIDWVLLFSPRTAATFARLVRDAGRADALKRCTALCLSAPVAETVASLPWHAIRTATKPDQDALLALIETPPADAAPAAGKSAPPPRATAPAGAPRRAAIGPAIAASVVTTAVVLGALAASAPLWRDLVLAPPAPPADAARLDALGARLDQLQRAAAAPASGAAEQRVAKVEGELTQRIAALSVELDALRTRLAALASAGPSAAETKALDELGQRTGALANQMTALQERVGAAERAQRQASTERARAAAFAVGVAELDGAARAGRPFAASLAALRALAPDAAAGDLLQPLEPYAASGVAPLERLKHDWPEAARQAKAAQVGAEYGREYGDWAGRAMRTLSGMFTIRRIGADVAGDDIDAVLARAGARLDLDDLSGALTVLAALPEPAAAAAKRWLDQARARRAVETALGQLTQRALGAIARSGG